MKWKRNQLIVNKRVDPTELITFTGEIGKLRIVIDQFFGDVGSRWYWGGKEFYSTTVYIHPTVNKYFEARYKELEWKKIGSQKWEIQDNGLER
jgi:hypothetical protein